MAAKRRGHGEGSVYQRARDGKWVGAVDLGRDAQGRRIRRSVVRKTKREALAQMDSLRRHGGRPGVPAPSATVAEFLAWWTANVLPGSVKESTERDYQGVIDRYILPHIGRYRVERLAPGHVLSMLRALEDRGLSARSRQYARAVLRRSLRHAERDGLVTRNVAALVDGPKSASTKLDDALTAAEAKAVLYTAEGDRLEALAILVLRLGLRKGEVLALQWPGIDLINRELTIAGTLKFRAGEGLYVDTTKTSAGKRTLPLIADTYDALLDHQRRQSLERQAAGESWEQSGFVFTTPRGRPIHLSDAWDWWRHLCERAGVGKRRFHASRHTAATLMLDQGVPLEVVSAILGHAGLAITADVYAKVTADSKRRALSKLDQALLDS